MTTVNLARLLVARGADVHLVIPDGSAMEQECVARSIPYVTLEPLLKYGDVLAAVSLGRIFHRRNPDIALFLRSQDMHLGAIAKAFSPGTRLVFYQQMQSGIGKKDLLHAAVFSRFSAWLTLTEIMRGEVLRWTNVPASRVHVAYLGRDAKAFHPSPERRLRARKEMRLPPRSFIAGVLGRLDRQKGQLEFLEAIHRAKRKLPKALFLIAGDETKNDPGMRERLVRRMKELRLGKSVRILPPTDNVPDFMAALDVFVMPSYSETYGLVLIEAMAMGLPVISTDSGGVPELVRDGKEGIIVEPKNVRQLSHALITLGTHPRLRQELGSNGRKRFERTFREDVCVDTLMSLLTRL